MTRKRLSYERPKAGEWIQPIRKGYRLVCCDCGLVHRMDFRIYRGRVQMRAWREEKETDSYRAQEGVGAKKTRKLKSSAG